VLSFQRRPNAPRLTCVPEKRAYVEGFVFAVEHRRYPMHSFVNRDYVVAPFRLSLNSGFEYFKTEVFNGATVERLVLTGPTKPT
jgi:hypothetical protein